MGHSERDLTRNVIEGTSVVDGEHLDVVLGAETKEEIYKILKDDFEKRSRLVVKEGMEFNPEKPFVLYEAMNRKPEKWVAVAVLRYGLMELGVDPNEEAVMMFAPTSATWMKEGLVLMQDRGEYSNIVVMDTSQNMNDLDVDQEIGEIYVSSYTKDRMKRNGVTVDVPKKRIYLENPSQIEGKRLIFVDDALAQGVTAEESAEGLVAYSPSSLDVIVTLSKGLIQKFEGKFGKDRVSECTAIDGYVAVLDVARTEYNGPDNYVIELTEDHQVVAA